MTALKTDVSCDFKNDFNCGYTTGSSLSELKWSREIEVEFPAVSQSGSKSYSSHNFYSHALYCISNFQ